MELPRVRIRVKPPTVGDRGDGVGSVTREERRAWSPPNAGPGVVELLALGPPKGLARGLEARRGRLGVEENRLGHGGRLILGDDDAAVARVVEVYLRQRPVMAAPGGQGRSVQRIRLALGVVERVGLGIQQMARVTLLGRRVEHRRRRRVGRAAAFSAAKQVSDHVEWAHSSMEARPSS
jgi:hypothetical protein